MKEKDGVSGKAHAVFLVNLFGSPVSLFGSRLSDKPPLLKSHKQWLSKTNKTILLV